MKNRSTLILSILLFFLIVSCKTTAIIPPETKTETKTITVKEVVHDTVFEIEKDSSHYKALLKCLDGKIYIHDSLAKNTGIRLEAPKVTLSNNELSIDCVAKAQELFAEWKTQHKIETVEIVKNVPYPVEKELSFWQKLLIWFGKVFLVILLSIAIRYILKFKNLI